MGHPAWTRDATGLLTQPLTRRPGSTTSPADRPSRSRTMWTSRPTSRAGSARRRRPARGASYGKVYAGHASRLSLRATVPAVWAAAHAGHSLVAAARAQSARVEGPGDAPGDAPGAAGATAEPAPVFAGIRGGVGRLPLAVRRAVESLGGEVRTGVTVRELRPAADPRQGRWELVTGSRADPRVLLADAVVLAVPARPASRLLADACPPAAGRLAQVDAASMALVTAVLPGAAGLVARSGSGFLVPPVEGRLVKAVTYSSAKWGWLSATAGDDLVVRLSIGRQGRRPTSSGRTTT